MTGLELKMAMGAQAVEFACNARGESWAPIECYLHSVACYAEHTATGSSAERVLVMLDEIATAVSYMRAVAVKRAAMSPTTVQPQVKPDRPFTLRGR